MLSENPDGVARAFSRRSRKGARNPAKGSNEAKDQEPGCCFEAISLP